MKSKACLYLYPFLTSAKSDSTISSTNSLNVQLGVQPRFFLALEQLPSNCSTSVGLKYFGLTSTKSFPVLRSFPISSTPSPSQLISIPTYEKASSTNSRTE
eukprot:NODE_3_length_80033_cov_0.932970.p77 type:complete len:101 gc:universal NODE_3_length_80033_cov_0.932970:76678-76376(-)